jgi:hypothetical protein
MVKKIYNIWIIKRPSGVCLVDVKAQELPEGIDLSGNLISGLLSAYSKFTEELLSESIKLFETESYKIFFQVRDKFYVAALCESELPNKFVEKMMVRIIDLIPMKYPDLLKDDFDGDLGRFQGLQKEIEIAAGLDGIKLMRFMRDKKKEIAMIEKIKKIKNSWEDLKKD